jgi:hypothetical protein
LKPRNSGSGRIMRCSRLLARGVDASRSVKLGLLKGTRVFAQSPNPHFQRGARTRRS